MSRTKWYGSAVAVITAGPDAVEDVEATIAGASDALTLSMSETAKGLAARGVELQWDTVKFDRANKEDHVLLSWAALGRQTRNVFQRILWAVKL